MGYVANFMGRVFARFRRDDGVGRGEGDTESPQPDVAEIRAQAFMEGVRFAEIVREAHADSDLTPEEAILQMELDIRRVDQIGYSNEDDEPLVH